MGWNERSTAMRIPIPVQQFSEKAQQCIHSSQRKYTKTEEKKRLSQKNLVKIWPTSNRISTNREFGTYFIADRRGVLFWCMYVTIHFQASDDSKNFAENKEKKNKTITHCTHS